MITTAQFQDAINSFSILEIIKLNTMKENNPMAWMNAIDARAKEIAKEDAIILHDMKVKSFNRGAWLRNKFNRECG